MFSSFAAMKVAFVIIATAALQVALHTFNFISNFLFA